MRWLALMVLVAGLSLAGSALARDGFIYSKGHYRFFSVPGTNNTEAFGINNLGQIVGLDQITAGYSGFVYENGQYTDITVPESVSTEALGINNHGDIVGTYTSSSGPQVGFIYSNGAYTTLNVPGSFNTDVSAINDAGEIVGTAEVFGSFGDEQVGFTYHNGVYTTFSLPGAQYTFPTSVNNVGEVIGFGGTHSYAGFAYDGTTFSSLAGFPGGINNIGLIDGTIGSSTGYIYDGSSYHTIPPSGRSGEFRGMNDSGQIVGFADSFVHEGSTWMIMIVGLGLLGTALRGRQQSADLLDTN